MFKIENTLSFNTDKLIPGTEYDYVTRTSLNQGVLQTTGFINEENINSAGTWSLGLLQMDFFYRKNQWYAGQFVRKITPKIKINESSVLFFTTLLNKQKSRLLSVLVRNVDKTFLSTTIQLPINNGEIDFDFMENFVAELEARRVAELEARRVAELEAYLLATGLKDYTLTEEEENVLEKYNTMSFGKFAVTDVFDIKNTSNILSCDITENSGETPYLCASAENNSVSSYISYNKRYIEEGNCIFIGGKTFVVSWQKDDFFSNDSHNLALYYKGKQKDRLTQLFLATCIKKSLCHKYSWGNSISKSKIKEDYVDLPVKDCELDLQNVKTLISAIQKLVIKDVVLYADRKIAETKAIITK